MRTSTSYEREIAKLRGKHTEHFNKGQWIQMQTIRRKLKETWAAFHRAKDREAKCS